MEFLEPLLNWRVVDGLDNKKLGKTLLILLRLLLRLPFNMRHLQGGFRCAKAACTFHHGGVHHFTMAAHKTFAFFTQAVFISRLTQRPA